MLKFELPSQTSLNQPTALPRVVKTVLEWRDELWYWQGELFDGYLYDIVNQRHVEIWRVQDGQIISRYFPEEFVACCKAYQMYDLPIIDITGFSLDKYNSITHWQTINHPYYQDGMTFDRDCFIVDGTPFSGMSITTKNNMIYEEEIWRNGNIIATLGWGCDKFFKPRVITNRYPDFSWGIQYSSNYMKMVQIFFSTQNQHPSLSIRFTKIDNKIRIKSLDVKKRN